MSYRKSLIAFVSAALLAAAAWMLPPLFSAPRAGEPATPVKTAPDPKEEAARRLREAEVMARVKRLILDGYVEKVEEKQLFYGALRGMVAELDPHSQFLTPEEYAELEASTTGEFGGLGIEVTVKDGWVTVVTPLVGTPAFKAGVLPGDRIVKIDGQETEKMTLPEAVQKMRGKPGTKIVLGVARRGQTKLLDITIVRQIIRVDSVRIPHLVDEKTRIGYVSLTAFQADSAEELEKAVKKLEAEGMAGLIIDLRANGGGRMDAAIKVADLFLNEGVIVSTRGRAEAGGDEEVYRARAIGTRPDYPLAVLVNQSSASASEIVAGALRDHHRAVLVGEKTFGKASVQSLQRIRIGSEIAGLKLTTAHYYTPGGHLIHGKGIEPDIVVPMDVAVLVEVLKRQHDRWVEINDPNKGKSPKEAPAPEGGVKDPDKAPEKAPESKAPEGKAPESAPPGGGAAEGGEVPRKEADKVVDVQLEAAIRALRAVIVDRQRGKPVKRVPEAEAAVPIPDVPPGGVR